MSLKNRRRSGLLAGREKFWKTFKQRWPQGFPSCGPIDRQISALRTAQRLTERPRSEQQRLQAVRPWGRWMEAVCRVLMCSCCFVLLISVLLLVRANVHADVQRWPVWCFGIRLLWRETGRLRREAEFDGERQNRRLAFLADEAGQSWRSREARSTARAGKRRGEIGARCGMQDVVEAGGRPRTTQTTQSKLPPVTSGATTDSRLWKQAARLERLATAPFHVAGDDKLIGALSTDQALRPRFLRWPAPVRPLLTAWLGCAR